MTTTADSSLERAFEAALAGRPLPPGAGGLAAFTEAVRATATQPGRPSTALAELLVEGLAVDRPVGSPPPARTRPLPGWASRVLDRVASAGATARVAACAGVAVAALTGAGTAGVLPAGAQHTFAQAVEAATSIRVPDPVRTTPADAGGGTATPPPPTTPTTSGTPTAESSSAAPPAPSLSPAAPPVPGAVPMPLGYDCDPSRPFGACVSRHMRSPDGPLAPGQVDEWARYHQAQRDAQPQADPGGTQGTAGSDGPATPPGGGSSGRPNGNGHADQPPGTGNGRGHR